MKVLLLLTILLTSCVASIGVRKKSCKQINDTMKICRDSFHETHCRIEITRNEPYPDTTDRDWETI